MANEAALTAKDKRLLGVTAVVGGGLWVLLLFLPWIAVNCDSFKLDKDKAVRVQNVLAQFGTYGDLYGSLNCLFSGAALLGVFYAVFLQRRELHIAEKGLSETRRTTELQNRVALYQYMETRHRHVGSTSNEDVLLAARSKGRGQAYAELIEDLLFELDSQNSESELTSERPANYHDHPLRILILNQRFEQQIQGKINPSVRFAEITDVLLELVTEIAALTVLIRSNNEAQEALLEAGHSVNAAVRPQDLLDRDELDDARFHRAFQVTNSQTAFARALRALRALGILPNAASQRSDPN